MPNNSLQKKDLTVILAAYKEAENLNVLLPRLNSVLSELTSLYEILVIDTIEPLDNTQEICEKYNVRYIKRCGGNNYGDAIRTGILESGGVYVVVMDADGSHPPEFIPKLWAEKGKGDIIIASRYIDGGRTENPWLLVFFSKILNFIFKTIIQFPVLDVSNSFRLYNGDKLRAIKLNYKHFDILEEILAKSLWRSRSSCKIIEVPFYFERRINGKSKRNFLLFSYHFFLAIFKLLSMRLSKETD
jgi:dolichol-phosphate mannosyltransferase